MPSHLPAFKLLYEPIVRKVDDCTSGEIVDVNLVNQSGDLRALLGTSLARRYSLQWIMRDRCMVNLSSQRLWNSF